ncbi:hypothetical protein L1987_71143 [Smallanthus sonchifolius]|uniref:Uncharacterized protein n=1 Tax=Smallanthus sonchifolius TaxID=185202 RepID=A0ACB9ASG2_9ASTR|nr:hypothetical protein L1987_71143 [Smallanthus sonchifolius]
MRLCKSGLNKQDAANRFVGEAEAFKSEPEVRVKETETESCSFSNNKMRENVMCGSSVNEKSRKGWFGQTSEVGSMRDQRSVAGDKLWPDELEGTGYEIERESLDHKCGYDQDKEIEREKDENGSHTKKPIKVTSMESCVTFLDICRNSICLSKKREDIAKYPKNWYYIKTKKDKINMKELSSSGESKFKKRRVSMVNKLVQDEMHGEDSKGNKEESENEDVVVEDNK